VDVLLRTKERTKINLASSEPKLKTQANGNTLTDERKMPVNFGISRKQTPFEKTSTTEKDHEAA
jgi:hypothetical protein